MEEHVVCKHEGMLGEMRATLKAQSEADTRIENNLKELVTAIQNDRETAAGNYNELKNNFTKIEEILIEQKKASLDHTSAQKEMKSSIDKLSARVADIEKDVSDTSNKVDNISKTSAGHEARIKKIERLIIKLAAITTALVGLVEVSSKLDDIKYFFFPELKKAIQQQGE